MLRAVLVGCGAMSKANIEAALATGEVAIVALVDLEAQRAAERAADFGLSDAALGADLDAVLAETRPDFVIDVVVPQARYNVVTTAFAHGCHVLSEKPLADTLDRARRLVAAASSSRRMHAVIQNRRYVEGVRRIARFLASGAIGDVTSLHCDFFLAPHFGGFREAMQHVLLLDMAIHTFDAARAMTGAEAEAVFCREWEPANSWYAGGSSAAAIFELSNGAVFTYRGSWCADGFRTSWEGAWRIVGERGSLTWDGADDLRAEVLSHVREGLFSPVEPVAVPPLDPADRVGGHRGLVADFVAALQTGAEPETVSRENLKSLAMVFAAIESAETGRRVALSGAPQPAAQVA